MKKLSLVQVICAGVPILFLAIYLTYIITSGAENKKILYTQGFSSVVLKSNVSKASGRATEFHLSNGLKLYFGLGRKDSLQIGDSIKKQPDTYFYDVYRKDEHGVYNYWRKFHMEKTL